MSRKLIFTFAFCLLPFTFMHAGWPTTPDSAIFVDGGFFPYLAVDPHDESITVIYLQGNATKAKKYDRYGDPLWGGNSVTLHDTAWGFLRIEYHVFDGQWGAVVSDDSGGAIVAWEDYRNADFEIINGEPVPQGSEIYVQRVDVNGQIRYGINGKRISGPAGDGFHEIGDMKGDYHGGFAIGSNNDTTSATTVLRRYNIRGDLLWQRYFTGAYIDVNATDENGNIFVSTAVSLPGTRHKLDLNGNHLWPDTLVGIIPDSRAYRHGGAFSDGMGGVIGTNWEYPNTIKINRADSSGVFVFGYGVSINASVAKYGYASDHAGGMFVSWTAGNRVRVQRVNKNGFLAFDSSGLSPCPNHNCFNSGEIVPDNQNGIISIWAEDIGTGLYKLVAQRIDSSGSFLWDSSGVEFLSSTEGFFAPPAILLYSDGRGGGIYIWDENGIRMKQISLYGTLGEVITGIKNENSFSSPRSFELLDNYPNPFNSSTTIEFNLFRSAQVELKVYNLLGQLVIILLDRQLPAGNYKLNWDGKLSFGSTAASGIYISTLTLDKRHSESKKMLLLK